MMEYRLLDRTGVKVSPHCLGASTDLVKQGKIRYAGCSTHPAWQVDEDEDFIKGCER
jgi:aryl-alcohol dehydrogenase-like predicted oxidoreductase